MFHRYLQSEIPPWPLNGEAFQAFALACKGVCALAAMGGAASIRDALVARMLSSLEHAPVWMLAVSRETTLV